MKPLVFYGFKENKDNENEIIINKEDFKRILEEVYNEGIKDGGSKMYPVYPTGVRSPIVPVEITCNYEDIGKANLRGTVM